MQLAAIKTWRDSQKLFEQGRRAGLSRSELDGLLLQVVLNSRFCGHCVCDLVPHNC